MSEGAKPRILIVDDSKFNVQFLKDILVNDYDLFIATSGLDCLHIVNEYDIDLILLDVLMPDMDGYEVCKTLKKNVTTEKIPVIFVTGLNEIENEAYGLEIGAIDYITKPINPAIVKARVKNHIELKKYRDILEQQSKKDCLTSLSNRRLFDQSFYYNWNETLKSNSKLSIVMIDIDYFKNYNDRYGHLNGDECLRQVACTLRLSLNYKYDVYRYGGEEFVVILPGVSHEEALSVADKMRESVKALKIVNYKENINEYLTVSVGVATTTPKSQDEPEILIEKADEALYQVKAARKDSVKGIIY